MTAWPRVTALVRLYNNAAFAQAAVSSALAQNYPNLEVLVADDASQDGSAALARALLDAYRGPHSVRLVQQSKNLGCGGNLEAAARVAEGEILVLFDGDDISVPTRVSEMVSHFADDVYLVAHRALAIGPEGEPLRPPPTAQPALHLTAAVEQAYAAAGAVSAYRRRLFEGFAPLEPLRHEEDRLLTVRALLLGRALLLDLPLVQRRSHARNISGPSRALASGAENRQWWLRHWREKFPMLSAMECDLRRAQPAQLPDFVSSLSQQRRRLRVLRAAGYLGIGGAWRCFWALRATGLALRPGLRLLLPQVAPELARRILARQALRRASLEQKR